MGYPTAVLVKQVVRRLQQVPAIPLATLARECGVSCRTLRRALKAHMGISYRELQTQTLRLRAEELQGGDGAHSIKEIAHALGFTRPQSFSRRMKAVMRDEGRRTRHPEVAS